MAFKILPSGKTIAFLTVALSAFLFYLLKFHAQEKKMIGESGHLVIKS